jgi:hypothetical protein
MQVLEAFESLSFTAFKLNLIALTCSIIMCKLVAHVYLDVRKFALCKIYQSFGF